MSARAIPPMQRLRTEQPVQNRVMALFEASAFSFELPHAATLQDLAGRLAHLTKRHGEALIGVNVRVSSQMRAAPSGVILSVN
jgi:hypothetical protein